MKKSVYFLIVTAIFVAVICVINTIDITTYVSVVKFLKISFISFSIIIYLFVLFFGLMAIGEDDTYKSPHFLCCGNERIIFIFDVKKDKIGIVNYKEGVNLKNFKLYSPEYIYPTEIPKNLRIKGTIIDIKRKEPCDNFDFFDYIKIET